MKGNTHYAVGKGLPELRQKIAEKLWTDNAISVTSDEVIATPGAKMAIYLAVRACINEGDEVLIPTPSWVSYTEIVRASGGVPIEVPLDAEDNYAISAERLQEYSSARTKMIILCSPNNPTGRMLTESEIEELVKYTIDKDIIILSDEVYEKISYIEKTISPASHPKLKSKTLTVNGFSKAYAMTGWRLGYVAGPKRYIDVINKLYTHTITGTSPFIQEAAIVALGGKDDVEQMRLEYTDRRNYFINALQGIKGIRLIAPDGAFYAWCCFEDTNNIANELLEKAKVVGVPGKAYGAGFEQYVRFSFANKMSDLVEAVSRIKDFMDQRER